MTTTKKVPVRACRFDLEDDQALRLAEGDGGKPTFDMIANSGKPILGHWWWGNLGIDLQGVKCKKRLAVLKDHDVEQRIGFTTAVEVDPKKGMTVRGQFLPSSELAAQVRQESLDGFPWQASVSLRPTKIERIPEGETVEVNGYTMAGPGHVFRKSECREVSFTPLGADSETSASALSATSAGELEAEFTDTDDTNMSNKPEPAAQPPANPNLEAARAEASSAALTAERNRVSAILSAAHPSQTAMATELVASGASVQDALTKLNADLREKLEQQKTEEGKLRAQLLNTPPQGDAPLSTGNAGGGASGNAQTPLDAAKAMPEGKEKWEKLFDLDPAIKAEFSSKEAFLAFKAAPASR